MYSNHFYNMDSSEVLSLFEKYHYLTATEEEKERLFKWIREEGTDEEIKAMMDKAWEGFHDDGILFTETESENMLQNILYREGPAYDEDISRPQEKRSGYAIKLALALMLVFLIAGGGFYYHLTSSKGEKQIAQNTPELQNDVKPGGNKAILTLGNGHTIMLDSIQNGDLAHQGTTKIIKTGAGQLIYKTNNNHAVGRAKMALNTLNTPRGGQYQIILPDGSRVWLNAASALTFPTAFTGNTREVTLKGEAYFEIAEDADKPFNVHVSPGRIGKGMIVHVLGTHFDIKAYENEPSIKTTLTSGAIKISKGKESRLLHPNDQANIAWDKDPIEVSKVNVEDVIAWKNGFFHFNGEDMGAIMRKLERWYDVTVSYKNGIPSGHYTGIISRNTNLSEVLKMLQLSGVLFSLQGKEIIVLS